MKRFISISLRYTAIFFITQLLTSSCKEDIMGEGATNKSNSQIKATSLNIVGHWKNEGDRLNLFLGVANEFEFINQDINVNIKFPEELYNADDSLEIQFIISQIQKPVSDWDVIRIKEHYAPIARILNDPYWGEKYLVDFSKEDKFIDSHIPAINSEIIKSRSGNILTGAYSEGQYWALYVNTEVAKRMGIEVKQYGMTFDDFLGYIKKANEYNKANNVEIAAIFEDRGWISTESIWRNLAFSLMGKYTDIIASTNLTPDKLKVIEKAYWACEELSKYNPIIKNRKQINWGRDNVMPLHDSCLFFVNGSWMYNIWRMKDIANMYKMLPCELPVFQPSDVYLGGYTSNWIVPKNAAHKNEAIKYVMFWCSPQVAEKWVRVTKCPSGVKGNLTTTGLGTDVYESFLAHVEKKYSNKLMPQTDNKYILGSKNFQISLKVIEVLEGTMTAEQAMREIKQKAIMN